MGRLLAYVFNFIFVIVLGWIISRVVQHIFGRNPNPRGSRRSAAGRQSGPTLGGETARDPVCGMFVSTEVSHQLKRGSETLHFCSQECLDRFQTEANHSS